MAPLTSDARVAAALLAAVLLLCAGCGSGQHAGPQGSQPAVSRIAWPRARSQLVRCQVKAVEQAHNRLVTLTLRGGEKVYAYEPRIDVVVHEVVRLQRRCGPITLAIE